MSTATKKLHGVYINPETKLSTMDVPHKVVEHGGTTYFIARHPEGDYAIHKWNARDQHGYGESEITFLLEDGSLRTVRGPYSTGRVFDFGTAAKVAAVTGISGIEVTAHRLTIGRNLWPYQSDPREVVFQEPDFILGDILPRLKREWAGLEVRIESRGSYSYRKVSELLEPNK